MTISELFPIYERSLAAVEAIPEGKAYFKERNKLRADYLNTSIVDLPNLQRAIADKLPPVLAKEALERIAEWEFKIAQGKCVRAAAPELTQDNLLERTTQVFLAHTNLLHGDLYTQFCQNRDAVRDPSIEELKTCTAEEFIQRHNLPVEFVGRIAEWKMKADANK